MADREWIESRDEMERILRQETIGYLGLSNDGDAYIVPLNYGYVEGRILFHCSLTGKKLDYIRANPNVCFSVGRQSGAIQRHAEGNPCHVDSESVLCYGRARIIEDLEERQAVLNEFNYCFRPEASAITLEAAQGCAAVEIRIAEMTGRRERQENKERTYWRWSFAD